MNVNPPPPPPPPTDFRVPPGMALVDGIATKLKASKLQKAMSKFANHLGPEERVLLVADLVRVRAPSSQFLLVTDQRVIGLAQDGKLGFSYPVREAVLEVKSVSKLIVGRETAELHTFDAPGNAAPLIASFVADLQRQCSAGESAAPPSSRSGDAAPGAHPVSTTAVLSVATVVDGVRVPTEVKRSKAEAFIAAARRHLEPSEQLIFVGDALRVRSPGSTCMAVTNHRVFLIETSGQSKITWWGAAGEVRAAARTSSVVLHAPGTEQLKVQTSTSTVHELAQLIDNLPPVPNELKAEYEEAAREEASSYPVSKDAAAAWMAGLPTFGSRPNAASARLIHEQSGGEHPWFVLGGTAGVLAAFSDRLLIVKAGAMTGLMAGTLGGHRVASFSYTEITGIEYNAGMVNGVLEILTASYQGTHNKDYWKGTNRSRNADANDPWTLSNTLPLDKATHRTVTPQLNELRRRITESKQQRVVVQPPPPSAAQPTLASELAELGRLRDLGVLSEDEFTAAKGRLLGGG